MQALTEVVQAGKARYVGFSEWPANVIAEALAMKGVVRFVSSQPQYSLLWRKPEAEIIPLCEANGISQIVWSPLAQGVLTGKYQPREAPASETRAASRAMGGFLQRSWLEPRVLEAVQKVRPIAEASGLTLTQFALAWVLRIGNVASAIIGATRPDQIEENVKASGHRVDPALFHEAERILLGVAAS